jgi:hypothetical protein
MSSVTHRKQPFAKIPMWVIERIKKAQREARARDRSPRVLEVYVAMRAYANNTTGIATPKPGAMGKKLGLSRTSLWRAERILVDAKVITKTLRHDRAGFISGTTYALALQEPVNTADQCFTGEENASVQCFTCETSNVSPVKQQAVLDPNVLDQQQPVKSEEAGENEHLNAFGLLWATAYGSTYTPTTGERTTFAKIAAEHPLEEARAVFEAWFADSGTKDWLKTNRHPVRLLAKQWAVYAAAYAERQAEKAKCAAEQEKYAREQAEREAERERWNSRTPEEKAVTDAIIANAKAKLRDMELARKIANQYAQTQTVPDIATDVAAQGA